MTLPRTRHRRQARKNARARRASHRKSGGLSTTQISAIYQDVYADFVRAQADSPDWLRTKLKA